MPGTPTADTAAGWPSVAELVRTAAQSFAGRPAVVDGPLRLTYAEFFDRVSRLAGGLIGLGVGPGDRVVVLSPNCAAVLELHFALALAGATTVALNTRFQTAELGRCIQNAEARLVFATAELAPRLPQGPEVFVIDEPGPEGAGSRTGREGLSQYEALIAQSTPRASGAGASADAPAALFYTSGSTGAPKGVRLTHQNVLAGALSCALAVGLDAESRWLHASPMFHLADAWAIWAATMVGACHVIERFDAPSTLRTIGSERITHTILVPTALDMLADAAEAAAQSADGAAAGPSPFASLTAMLYGGAPIAESTYRRMVALGVPMFHTYGSTETAGCMAVLRPGEHVRADGSVRLGVVGRAVPLTLIVIVDDRGEEVPAGLVGEITIASPNVMQGYNEEPALTADALQHGRYRTGDLGRVDADGFVELRGRLKEMLISGGENVYPNEVELVLREHPAVRDVGVGGIADDRWGQRIAAVVVPHAGSTFTLDDCRAFLAERLAGYKVPRSILLVDELPRNASGKIDRAALGALLAGDTALPHPLQSPTNPLPAQNQGVR